ncbi:serine hydrolase domain-containing protein [Nonomuraea candida]|uniref:serine hydrolase domain-containing protein n=1 Tax=Nonomuraea candida TaxID=359159 RepID=UPI0005BE4AFA|nr:serine hydrolase domain-containing protein [Nonomuraea candida]
MSDRLEAILADGVPRVCAAAIALIAVDGSLAAAAATGELVRYTGPIAEPGPPPGPSGEPERPPHSPGEPGPRTGATGESERPSGPAGEPWGRFDAWGRLAGVRPAARLDSIFDLASVSKLFTTVVLLSLAEEGRLDLDEPVAGLIPGADPRITPRRLLTHTAGLPPTRRVDLELPGADPATRMAAMVATPILHPVGGPYLYSDVGMVMAGRLAELAGGAPLDALARTRITTPLALTDTAYRPVTPALRTAGPAPRASGAMGAVGAVGAEPPDGTAGRVAATEWKPERPGPGCVRGEVHDETAYALGGVAGHAGLFATAGDLLTFGETLRRGGGPVLRPESVAEMTRDQGAEGAPFRHGLGVRLGDPGIIGPLDGAYGHSGFTGTSLVIDPARGLTVVLLTNAVHPVRGRAGIRELRHAVAAEALRLR